MAKRRVLDRASCNHGGRGGENPDGLAVVDPGSLRIRSYEAGDAPAIARLFYETVRSVNRAHYSEEQVAAWAPAIPEADGWHARMSGRLTLVAEAEGGVVGFAELEEDGHLDMLYVHKDAVGSGVGARLYEAVEREALDRGLGRITTDASITARPFFERRGFRLVREQTVRRRGMALTNFAMERDLPGRESGANPL